MTTLFQATGKLAEGRLLEADLDRPRKLRDKADHGGGVWQSWNRIVEVLELTLIIQDGIAEQATGGKG